MKLFRTNDVSFVNYCQQMLHFELPSIMLEREPFWKIWNWTKSTVENVL